MATERYGVNYNKAYVAVPAVIAPKGSQSGKSRHCFDYYQASTILADDDTIKLFKLPAGARVIDMKIKTSKSTSTGGINIGWSANGVDAADEDGFCAIADVHTAALLSSPLIANPGILKEFTVETQVVAQLSAAIDATDFLLEVACEYVVD